MIALSVGIATIIVFVVFLAIAVRGQSSSIDSLERVTTLSRPVDIDAFRNLISASEEDFLRGSLSSQQFRRVQRLRMRAALDYLGRAAHNSSILLRLGESSRTSTNPRIAAAGRELADTALQMRILCLVAMAVTVLRIALPQVRVSPSGICDKYAATRDRVVAFGRIEQPSFASRLESAL